RAVLQIERAQREELFPEAERWNAFAEAALRHATFCIPEGERWTPGSEIDKVELCPLLIWQSADGIELPTQPDLQVILRDERAVFGGRKSSASPSSLFVAFRMKDPESRTFREELEVSIKRSPSLRQLQVRDGSVPGGTAWAGEIRRRIKAARLVVGDVTGL